MNSFDIFSSFSGIHERTEYVSNVIRCKSCPDFLKATLNFVEGWNKCEMKTEQYLKRTSPLRFHPYTTFYLYIFVS